VWRRPPLSDRPVSGPGRRALAPALAGLLATLVLAGCTSSGDTAGNAVEGVPEIDEGSLAKGRGGIAGVIVDASIRPVDGASLRLTGPNGTAHDTVTGADGSFTFVDLVPGAYVVEASAAGLLPAQAAALVEAGQVTQMRVVLAIDPSPQPYVMTYKKDGYMELWSGIGQYYLESLVQNGTGLCDCRVLFTPEPNATAYVIEAFWDFTTPDPLDFGEFYWVLEHQDGSGGEAGYCYSPCHATVLEESVQLGQVPSYARLDGPDFWIAAQQRFQLFLSVWYHGLPPEGWSIADA
jgi:hypothetical protein